MVIFGGAIGFGALMLFIFAFGFVWNGRPGRALAFGLLALVMSGISGAVIAFN